MPMCGFSAQVVQVLRDEGVDFASVNVLDYPAIREGVKQFSQWPVRACVRVCVRRVYSVSALSV